MQKNDLTAREICNIIRACKDTGLTKLEFGQLHLEFNSTTEIVDSDQPQQIVTKPDEVFQPQLDLPGLDAQPLDFQEMKDQMMIMDPERWEKLELEGESYAEDGHRQAE